MLFNIFKKTVDETVNDTIVEVLKNKLAQEIISKINEAHDVSKALSGDLLDINKKLSILEKANEERTNFYSILNIVCTLGLAAIIGLQYL